MDFPSYNVYKGLQKPLIFKAFKGKYIYWGIGTLVGSLLIGVIVMTTISMVFGTVCFVGLMVGGLLYIANRQKKGLHNKKTQKGVFVVTNHKLSKFERR